MFVSSNIFQEADENREIHDILERQKVIDKKLVETSQSIKRLEKEISKLENQKEKREEESVAMDETETKTEDIVKRCKYKNRGFCKYLEKCRYFHPSEICPKHLENLKCNEKECTRRHPKICKWYQRAVGCRRNNCDFLHVTLAGDDGSKIAHKLASYKCEGCKGIYPSESYVVKHEIENMHIWFCLNCDEWIQDKKKVLEKGWTLFDQNGDLRRDV